MIVKKPRPMADADYNIATFDDNGLLPPVRAVERIAGGGDLEKAWQLLRNAVRDGALTAYVVDNQDSIFKADPLRFFVFTEKLSSKLLIVFHSERLKPLPIENGQKIKGQLFFLASDIEKTFPPAKPSPATKRSPGGRPPKQSAVALDLITETFGKIPTEEEVPTPEFLAKIHASYRYKMLKNSKTASSNTTIRRAAGRLDQVPKPIQN
jgi:hypothetical protein